MGRNDLIPWKSKANITVFPLKSYKYTTTVGGHISGNTIYGRFLLINIQNLKAC